MTRPNILNSVSRPRNGVATVPITYCQEWQDGFGARGWKLDSTLDDPAIIASTAETGNRINTSVLVHDILDHYLCGFPLGGHRNEAMALIQLAERTGSDPRPDYEQMVDEDLLNGTVNGEKLRSFLPPQLVTLLSSDLIDGAEIIRYLVDQLGREQLRTILVDRFFELGQLGRPLAEASWARQDLNYSARHELGLCIQELIAWGDRLVKQQNVSITSGKFSIGSDRCRLAITIRNSVASHECYLK